MQIMQIHERKKSWLSAKLPTAQTIKTDIMWMNYVKKGKKKMVKKEWGATWIQTACWDARQPNE